MAKRKTKRKTIDHKTPLTILDQAIQTLLSTGVISDRLCRHYQIGSIGVKSMTECWFYKGFMLYLCNLNLFIYPGVQCEFHIRVV